MLHARARVIFANTNSIFMYLSKCMSICVQITNGSTSAGIQRLTELVAVYFCHTMRGSVHCSTHSGTGELPV